MFLVYVNSGKGTYTNKGWRFILTEVPYSYWLKHRDSPSACCWIVPGTISPI